MKNYQARSLLRKLLVLCVFALYFVFLLWRYSSVFPDSDYSNLIIEGYDVLNGNIFRQGWTLTGVSFLTTDIVFFIIGVLFAGISNHSYIISCSLMVLALMMTLIPLVKEKFKENYLFALLQLLTLAAVFSRYSLSVLRAHSGAFIICFIVLGLTNYIYKKKNLNLKQNTVYALVYILIVALAAFGDPLVLIVTVAPVCIWSFIARIRKEINNTAFLSIVIVNLSSFLLSIAMDHFYFMFGCNKNSFLEYQSLTSIDLIGEKLCLYFKCLLMMIDSSFDMNEYKPVRLLFYPFSMAIIIVFFCFIVFNFAKFICGKEYDYLTVVLGGGFVLISFAFIFTTVSIDINSARYICYFPMLLAIVFLRNVFNLQRKGKAYYLIMLLVFFVAIGKCISLVNDSKIDSPPQQGLAEVLKSNDLHCGYASYWNASATTLFSDNEVRVRAVTFDDDLYIFNWFYNSAWYEEEANFVVTSDDDPNGITPDNIVSIAGVPNDTLYFDSYTILIYNYDISSYLRG